jgi:type II secretory pathway pseudopilin PulG
VHVGSKGAFTLVEVAVALVVLSVGVLALLGSAALMSRMIGRGRQSTLVGQVAATRIERLRQVAFATIPPCTGTEWRSDCAIGPGLTESWQILDPAGPARRVRIVLRARHPTGTSTDTVITGFLCGSP